MSSPRHAFARRFALRRQFARSGSIALMLGAALALPVAASAQSGPSRTSAQPAPRPATLPVLEVSTFPSPGASFWFSSLIRNRGLDVKHGFRLEIHQKTSQAAYADFISGASKVCHCLFSSAGLRFVERGAKVSQIWINEPAQLFVVTNRPDIRTLKDLEGRVLGSDTVSGAWAMSSSLLRRSGVDLGKVKVQSGSFAKVVTELTLGRIDAVAVEKGALKMFVPKDENAFRLISLTDSDDVRAATQGAGLPGWGVGAWTDWASEPHNHKLLKALYAASRELARDISADPERAASEIAAITKQNKEEVLWEIRRYWIDGLAPARRYAAGFRLLGNELLPVAGVLDAPLPEAGYDAYLSPLELE